MFPSLKKIRMEGLDPERLYYCNETKSSYYGDELMNMGFLLEIEFTGSTVRNPIVMKKNSGTDAGDFTAQVYVLQG